MGNGGRPAEKLITDHFTRTSSVKNQSGRHYFTCDYCDVKPIEGRDQRPAVHLSTCAGATPEVRREALTHLSKKGKAGTDVRGPLLGPHVNSSEPSESAQSPADASAAPTQALIPTKKRKGEGLNGYVDHPLSKSQKEIADVKFFRFIVHSNSAFRVGDNPYLKDWINTLRPSYEIPSRYVLSKRLLDAEASRVKLEDIDRVKSQRAQTLLFDGWEDKLRRSLYGTVSAGMGQHPTVLALKDMTGARGSADNHLETIKAALSSMEIGDAKNIIALTTDNPTVMRSFRSKFQAEFHWVLTFACFLHLLNTIIGKITVHPDMKSYISAMATVVSFFNSSHYWGGQLADEAKNLKIGRSLKGRTESRWYSLILQALSVIAHRTALVRVCSREDAQRRIDGNTPVSATVIKWVFDITFWDRLEQLVRICKPIVDAVGNLELREANLADCMLELLRCAQHVTTFEFIVDRDSLSFSDHARNTFMREFYEMNTAIHSLALFLHPQCRRLAVSQVAKSRTFKDMCVAACNIATQWKWTPARSSLLVDDMQRYHAHQGVFAGGLPDALEWWTSLAITGTAHPLKTLAITLFSVVPHSADVERLFSGLSGIQGVKRCNLSVPTFEMLGKLRNNYTYHVHLAQKAEGLETRRKHGHMHTRTEPGIDTALADRVDTHFSWQPPLLIEEVKNDVGPDTSTGWAEGEMERELAEWENRLAEEARPQFSHPVPQPFNIYDFEELARIDAGIFQNNFDEDHSIHVDEHAAGGTWDIQALLASKGISA